MRVYHIETFAWSPYLETSIELAINEKKINKNEVIFIYIFSLNYDQGIKLKQLFNVIIKIINTYRILKKNNITFKYYFTNPLCINNRFVFNDYNEIEKFNYDDTDIKYGIMSTLNDLNTNNTLKINEKFNFYANRIASQSIQIYQILKKIIDNNPPDLIYSFNTRFASTRPIYEISKKYKIKLLTYDSPESKNKYFITENSLFDGYDKSQKIIETWNNSNEDKFEIGKLFFNNLQKKSTFNEVDEVEINKYISKDKTNIIFYPSSIHETFALGDLYKHNIFSSQIEALEYLIEKTEKLDHINFIVRLHPILNTKDEFEQMFWKKFTNHKHIKVIGYNNKISSYQLLKHVDFCITYHSTIGIEAAYLKVKSIVLGSPWYVNLKCIYTPKDITELNKFLKNVNLDYNFIYDQALYYGYFLNVFGNKFKYINAITKNDVRIFNIDLKNIMHIFKKISNE